MVALSSIRLIFRCTNANHANVGWSVLFVSGQSVGTMRPVAAPCPPTKPPAAGCVYRSDAVPPSLLSSSTHNFLDQNPELLDVLALFFDRDSLHVCPDQPG
jgi:hypothetical protein